MDSRKNTQTPRMDRKTLILTVVGALLVIAIIVIAVVLMQRSGGDTYKQNYEAAMEHYIAGQYSEAIDAARLAYNEDATEEAALIIARSYAALGDYTNAVSTLEGWVNANGSGSEAGTLLEEYRAQLEGGEEDENSVTIAGEKYDKNTQTLVISDQTLTSADLETIASLTELTSLSLNGCSLSDLTVLAQLTGLTSLSLENNSITDLAPLGSLRSLNSLYLSGNADIESLEPLYGLDGLTTLDIRGREITDEELEALQEELPGCTILTDTPTQTVVEITLGGVTFESDVTELNLSGLGLTDISALSACTALESLDISNNQISDISVLAAMPNLKTLSFSSNQVSSISPLLALTNLEVLRFSGNNVSNIAALSGHTAITELDMSDNPLDSLTTLSTLTGLKTLTLQSCGLEDSDLETLRSMTWLSSLSIDGNTSLTRGAVDELVAALSGTEVQTPEQLYTVELGGQSFAADSEQVDASGLGVTDLAGLENFTSILVLNLNDNEGIDISNVGAAPTLQSLELSRCGLTDISALANAAGLTTLSLMQNDITDVSPLRHLANLTELHLSLNENLEDITPLSMLSNLKTISLNGTAVTDLSALAGLTSLETLDIEGCRIDSIEPLLGLKNLRTLYAANCGLSQSEIDELGQALPNCTIYT